MFSTALFITHKTLPGRRDDVRAVWLKHMAPAVQDNAGHTAYFYCFSNTDSDTIYAFQEYASPEAAKQFLSHPSYLAYLKDVEPLLSGPPDVKALTPMWTKMT